MNFNLAEEQQLLKDSIARFVQDQYSFDARREITNSQEGFSRENWQTFAELGWLSIPFAEQDGGYGGGATDTMVIMEEFGRGLVVEPYVATVLLFGGLISHSENGALRQALIEQIIAGELQGAFAYLERQSRFELSDIKTTAEQQGDQFVLNGNKALVANGMAADKLVVSARTDGAQTDEAGISLFVIDANAEGVDKSPARLMDGQLAANISLNNVAVDSARLVGEPGGGHAVMQAVVKDVMVAICAEALGIMQTLNDTTVEYTKTREQFGVPISSFQALQHRMVDMFMACEQTKSLLYRAVCSIEEDAGDNPAHAAEVEKNILALKVMVGRAGRLIGGEAIQLHGAMGMTDELAVGHYAKRLMMINTAFGDADYQQQKFASLTNA